jgi:hypothetical protein
VWRFFEQRLLMEKRGADGGLDERRRVAVNCATGAWGNLSVKTFDKGSAVAQHESHQVLDSLESTTWTRGRLSAAASGTRLDDHVLRFACLCPTAIREHGRVSIAEKQIEELYEREIARAERRGYRLGFIRVADEATARKVIARLDGGEPFARVADDISEARDEFPQGNLGLHAESQWTSDLIKHFRSLKVGQHSPAPHEGMYGWEIYKLLEIHRYPPPALSEVRADLVMYLEAQAVCAASRDDKDKSSR